MSWFRPASGCNCEGSAYRNSEGFWIAVVGSNGAGWKVSSLTKSEDCCCGWVVVEADLRPVIESQLCNQLAMRFICGARIVRGVVHGHLEDFGVDGVKQSKVAPGSQWPDVTPSTYKVQN